MEPNIVMTNWISYLKVFVWTIVFHYAKSKYFWCDKLHYTTNYDFKIWIAFLHEMLRKLCNRDIMASFIGRLISHFIKLNVLSVIHDKNFAKLEYLLKLR